MDIKKAAFEWIELVLHNNWLFFVAICHPVNCAWPPLNKHIYEEEPIIRNEREGHTPDTREIEINEED